jgi:hypothetical protein
MTYLRLRKLLNAFWFAWTTNALTGSFQLPWSNISLV